MPRPKAKTIGTTDLARRVVAGLVGGLLATGVGYALFDWSPLSRVIMDPQLQSPKLLKVWREIQPLPLLITNPALLIGLYAVLGVAHSLVYRAISGSLGKGMVRKGVSFGLIIWIFQYVFFEYFTPFNLFGEPAALVVLELGIWLIVALVEGLAIAALSKS